MQKKALKQINNLEQKLEESGKDIISISDSDARMMINKKGRWEFCYNYQIAVDAESGIIVSTDLTQNPTDFNELQPQNREFRIKSWPISPRHSNFSRQRFTQPMKQQIFLSKNTWMATSQAEN